MEILTMIVSSSPYGDERIWDALRLAEALICSSARMRMNIFLIGDAVNAAKKGQKPTKGFYNIEKMLVDLVRVGAKVSVCHTSMNLRGLTEHDLIAGTKVGTITGLSKWIEESESSVFLDRLKLRHARLGSFEHSCYFLRKAFICSVV